MLQNIRTIVEEIVAAEKADVRLALVEYRDHPPQDSSFVTSVHDFTPSVKTMKGSLRLHCRSFSWQPTVITHILHLLDQNCSI